MRPGWQHPASDPGLRLACGGCPGATGPGTRLCAAQACCSGGVAWAGNPCPLLPSQEETLKGEGTEPEPGAPEAEDDGRRHGFLILSREDSTMVRHPEPGLGPYCEQCPSPTAAHRSCRRGRRSWSWMPAALPRRAPRSLLATLGTIATSCRCRRSASACWFLFDKVLNLSLLNT